MVHTTLLPLRTIFSMVPSERKPWFTQCRCTTSASRYSRVAVTSWPKSAMSVAQRSFFVNPLQAHITARSMMLAHDCFSSARANGGHNSRSQPARMLRRHSIVASTPCPCSACSNRDAAIAAPPVREYVLSIRTFNRINELTNYEHHQRAPTRGRGRPRPRCRISGNDTVTVFQTSST